MLWSLLFIFIIDIPFVYGDICSEPKGIVQEIVCCSIENLNLTNKITSQSSSYENNGITYTSDRAVDRMYDTCSITDDGPSPWWKIDLGGVYNISCISIFNKNENNCNLNNSQIHIGKLNNTNKLVQNITNFQECKSNVYSFKPTVGRYITVFFSVPPAGVLCDVNVTGQEIESPFKLIKKKMIWEDALYYCRENYMNMASILDEEAQAFAELEAEKAETDHVWLGLHYTCSLQFWFWVDNNAVSYKNWEENSKIENCDTSGVMRKSDYAWVSKSDYEEYNFICAKK